MSPLDKGPHEASEVNRRLKYVGRANYVMARLVVPHVRDPHWLHHMLVMCDRDIYQETCDAMGYDPLAGQRAP